jgi:GNAT superfamily N-acetyltransferase
MPEPRITSRLSVRLLFTLMVAPALRPLLPPPGPLAVGLYRHSDAARSTPLLARIDDHVGVLRDFIPEDQPAVRELVLGGMRERWGTAYDPSANPDLDDISTRYVDQGAEVVVAQAADAIVATGILWPETDRCGRLLRVSVDQCHRRRGFGRLVVEELVRRARHRGMVEVVASTDTPWTSALALYCSCGFACASRDDRAAHFSLSL